MADKGEGDQRKAGGEPDPLDEQTQPHVLPTRPPEHEDVTDTDTESAADPASQADLADLDTTTWSGGQAPPAQIEARPTLPEESEGGGELDAGPTVVAPSADPASVPEPEPEPEPEPQPEMEMEPESVAEPVLSVEEAPTVVLAAAAATDTGSKSAIAPSSALHPMLLERIEPSLGRGERLRLDAAHWRVSLGRADQNDIRLYTASASREHAVIAGNEAGDWVVTPSEGKSVKIDGEEMFEPVVLEVGMNLVLGGDHLRCVTEGLQRSEMSASTSAEGLDEGGLRKRGGSSPFWWLIGGIALLGVGLILFAWFTG